MPQVDQSKPEDLNTPDENEIKEEKVEAPAKDVDQLVAERVAEALKPIKEKLDKAYESRDTALKKLEEAAQKEREAQLKLMKEEGRHREAYELEISEERARRQAAETRAVELTRDAEIRLALGAYAFRNEQASAMAFREILPSLIQNEQGQWVHKSGVSVRDFVKTFVEADDNAFLLRPKVSSGTGSSTLRPIVHSKEKVSLFNLSQEEVLKRAREGTLR